MPSFVKYHMEPELLQAWGEWISGLSDWEWFVTMTFRDPGLSTWTKPGWAFAKRAWREFLKRSQPGLGELAWVRVFEIQSWRGVPHIHALVGNVDPSVRRMDLVDWSWKSFGMARILEYDAALGAQYYLCKYVTKELGDIEFGGVHGTLRDF